jgi:alpha-L-fucosidase
MKNKFVYLTLITCGLLIGTLAAFGQDAVPDVSGLKFGLYIHFGLATYAHPGEGLIAAERFAPPATLDVKAWVHAAKEAGMTFAVLTAKHVSGFCLWDSPGYSFDVAQSPFKGDIIGDFFAACNAEDILPGLHYSIPDAYNEGAVRFGKAPVSPVYFAQIKKQLTELHTRYPGIRIEVLDGDGRLSPEQFDEIKSLIKQLTPDCMLWNTSKRPERGPLYVSDSIIKGWMWRPQPQLVPAETLFDHYSSAVEKGQPYLLNVGPDTSGRIPDDQMAILTQLKDMIATRPLIPPPAATPTATQPTSAERLKQVKDLYDQGLINKDDYDKKVKAILDSM